MNRLLTILLLLGATAHGQIDNPPTPSSIGLGPASDVTFNRVATTSLGSTTNPAIRIGASNSGFLCTTNGDLYSIVNGSASIISTDYSINFQNPAYFVFDATIYLNASVGGTLAVTGNVTMSGVNNTMPNATNAASASSLMTRELVGQEFANPRTKMQRTYWFGLEGLGEWSLIGSGAVGGYGGASGGIGGGQYIYSSQTVGTNHAGAALRLGNDTSLGTTGIYRFSDGGALTMRVRMRKGDTLSVPAIAFVMGLRTATEMWQQNAYGIYFVPQPTNSWVSNAVVTQNSRIEVSNVVWAVNTAGTNAATEPTWTDLIGSLVTNGSAVYRNLGPHTSNNYVLAIGSTNASQVVMTNTGKAGPTVGARQEIVLKLRIDGTTSTPYTVYGTAENSTGESSEVSLTTTNNESRQPQIWSRPDNLGTRTNSVVDMLIRYFSVDGVLNPL